MSRFTSNLWFNLMVKTMLFYSSNRQTHACMTCLMQSKILDVCSGTYTGSSICVYSFHINNVWLCMIYKYVFFNFCQINKLSHIIDKLIIFSLVFVTIKISKGSTQCNKNRSYLPFQLYAQNDTKIKN